MELTQKNIDGEIVVIYDKSFEYHKITSSWQNEILINYAYKIFKLAHDFIVERHVLKSSHYRYSLQKINPANRENAQLYIDVLKEERCFFEREMSWSRSCRYSWGWRSCSKFSYYFQILIWILILLFHLVNQC